MKSKSVLALLALSGALAGCSNTAALPGGAPIARAAEPVAKPAPATNGAPQSGAPITISVAAGERQKFGGFGASVGNWSGTYQKLSPAERTQLSRLLWHDLKFNTLRMWFDTDQYAPTPGARDLTAFTRQYLDSGLIADARKQGVTTLLLAPEHLPDYMKGPGKDGGAPLLESQVNAYAEMVADFIADLQKRGVSIDVTGVQNEPNINELFSPAQLVAIVKQLRAQLDKRGLQNVEIIASEHSSSDNTYYKQLDALKADAAAWNDIVGVSSHSYNMAATAQAAAYVGAPGGRNSKEYWMTEASDNGAEDPGNSARAVSLAARYLNDMNHRVTHWVHFLGFETDDPKDNATRIISYSAAPFKTTVFQKYYTYQQLSDNFDAGAIFRASQSSTEGDMTWTYGLKPRVIAATAQNPDGSWGVGISNYTADSFAGVQGWSDDKWNSEQGGHTPGQTIPVTISIAELKDRGAVKFAVHRSNAGAQNAQSEPVTMNDGQVTLQVAPLELVTLRSLAK